jgi:hypothetical protein
MAAEGRRPSPAKIPVLLAALVILLTLLSFVAYVAGGFRSMPVAFGRTPVGVLGLVLSPVCYAAVGGVLAAFAPRNPVGWLLLAASMTIGVVLPVNVLVTTAHEALRPPGDMVVWVAWARTAFGTPVMVPLLIATALVFPDGRSLGGWWPLVLVATLAGGVLLVFATAVDPRGLWSYPSLPNPGALPYDLEPVVGAIRMVAAIVLVPCVGLAVASLWFRYRRGDHLLRAQLHWIVVAAAISGIAVLPYFAARYVLVVDDAAGEVTAAVAQLGSCALPLAAAFAISRYRLFGVDVLVGRTLVYLPLMAVLGGMYTAGIGLFQRLFIALTGETSDLSVVFSVLIVASAFTPVRRALESAVDRRFPAAGGQRPAAVERARGPEPQALEATAPIPSLAVVPVDDTGHVACPLGGRKSLVDCLACPRLSGTVAGPSPAIACRVPASLSAASPPPTTP